MKNDQCSVIEVRTEGLLVMPEALPSASVRLIEKDRTPRTVGERGSCAAERGDQSG